VADTFLFTLIVDKPDNSARALRTSSADADASN
jgi:hypothetical protein